MTMKKKVSSQGFEKQVEIESAYLQHYNHLPKEQADKSAHENITNLYEVE